MEKLDIEKLRCLPIEEVAERLGMSVAHHKALCPFHSDQHPSLSFHRKSNTFKCFVCDAHGDVITLARRVLQKSFPATCQWLASREGISLSRPRDEPRASPASKAPRIDLEFLSSLVARPTLSAEARAFLFEERRLRPEVVEWTGIGSISRPAPCWRFGRMFYDAPSLLIPYRDIDGRVQNVQSRYLGHEAGKPRFRFPAGSSIHVFNLPMLRHLSPGEPLYVSEGVTDCLALLSAGHKAIAIPSATLLKPQDLEVLRAVPSLQELHIYPDHDEAGERLYRQLAGACTQLGLALVRHPLPEGCKDFSEYYKKMLIKN